MEAMLDRIKFWLKDEGLDMKGFLELGESYDMKGFELALDVVHEIEATIQQPKKDNKYYLYRGRDGNSIYATKESLDYVGCRISFTEGVENTRIGLGRSCVR